MGYSNKVTKEQLFTELEALKKKIKVLESNKKFSEIIAENTSDNIAITTFDLKAEYIYVSPSVKQVLGYDPEDLIGMSFFDFIHPNDKKIIFSLLKKHINNKVKKNLRIDDPSLVEKIEFRFRDKAGNWRYSQSTINFVGSNLLSVTRDITEQKKAEQTLNLVNQNLAYERKIFQDGNNVVFKWKNEENWPVEYVSDNVSKILGYAKEDFLTGKVIYANIIHKDDLPTVSSEVINATESRLVSFNHKPYRIISNSGKTIWLYDFTNIIRDENNKATHFYGYINDVTELMKTKQALIDSEFRWQFAVDGSELGLWDWNIETSELYFSPRWKKMLGFEENEIRGSLEEWEKRVHPDDKEKVFADVNKHLEGKTNVYVNEHRILTKNGSYKWILARGKVLDRTQDNEPKRMIGTHTDVTERKLAEKKLRESLNKEEAQANIVRNSPIAIAFGYPDGRLGNCNKAYSDLTGYSQDELSTINWNEVLTPLKWNKIEAAELKKLSSENNYIKYEKEYIHKSGDIIPIELVVSAKYDGQKELVHFIAFITNITERKKAEAEVDKLSKLVMQSPAIIVITDLNGNIEFVNNRFLEITGYTKEEALGSNPRILKSNRHPKGYYKGLWEKVSAGEEWHGELLNKNKAGGFYWESANIFPIFDGAGTIINYIKESVDITERKKTEKKLEKQTKDLIEQNIELDAFSHTVAHDLKNPIGNMMGFASLLLNDYPSLSDKEMEKYINTILRSGHKTQQIINSLLQLASVRADKVKTKIFNIKPVVDEAISRFSSLIEKANVEIGLPEIWPEAIGHAPWVEEVFVNYLSNAIKYGGTPPKIEMGFDMEDSDKHKGKVVRYWVRDNGEGIDTANYDIIFNKFERISQANIKGQGLGLSIVKRIIEKLGGTVGVESKNGEGSLFYFTLPTSKEEYQKFTSQKSEIKTISLKTESKKLKILIAEDDFVSYQLISILVKNISEEIFYAKDGKEAVEIFANNRDIDLILMDIYMPQISGIEATKQIRMLDKNVIIIAQTAFAFSGNSEKAIEVGCNDYITKPINKDKLIEMIWKWINISDAIG